MDLPNSAPFGTEYIRPGNLHPPHSDAPQWLSAPAHSPKKYLLKTYLS